jgi:Bacterial protein of unknown function (DUF839)
MIKIHAHKLVPFLLAGGVAGCTTLDLEGLDLAGNAAPVETTQNQQELIGDIDYGLAVQETLERNSLLLFGFIKPIKESAPATTGPVRALGQPASAHVKLAQGLNAKYLTREAANHADMMSFWPANSSKPTHAIFCIESGREVIGKNADGSDKYNPSVQAVRLSDGKVKTILRGMDRCDGVRTTPWGTIIPTEEADDGGLYEIIDPLNVDATVVSRGAAGAPAVTSDPRVVKRTALTTMAWEGLLVLPSGVVIGGDELRPGTGTKNSDGGAIFKFVPSVLRTGSGLVTDLSQSPLAAGSNFAMQVSCIAGRPQFGQGCEIGNAGWIPVGAATARADANIQGATGFYRPEDLEIDPGYKDAAKPAAIRFCFANTGNAGGANYSEVMCAIDAAPDLANPNPVNVVVNRFVEGDEDFNQADNLAFQPKTGNLYVIEDNGNGDIFACLKDGKDRDIKSDGCVKVLSVVDTAAEPTGFTFLPDGKSAIVSIQHSDDTNMPLVDGFPTDDLLLIRGFATF